MIQSIVNSVKSNKFNEIMYAFHLLDKINYKRLAFRVRQTVDSPQIRMKVVLFEYDYTKLADINNGAQEGRLETIPGTRVHVQYVVHTDAFKELMQNMFCNMPGFTWFHRNRWENGKLNLNRRQVVLMYTPVTEKLYPSPELTAVAEDEDDYGPMPPLIPFNEIVPPPIPPQLNVGSYNVANTTFYNPNNMWATYPTAPNLVGMTQYN